MIAQVQKDENNQNIAVPISGSIPTGLPVGTWISFEKDQTPDNKWIKAGETFDENLYPALYLFLGTNKVPERFDHNRLSAYEEITLPTSSATAITMQYDGTLVYQGDRSGTHYIYINDVQICFDRGSSNDDSALTVSFRKGDVIWVTITGTFVSKVAYYKHPMFIKATSAIEITDQSTFLNTVVNTIHNMGSYSTEEIDTGEVWIDGKTIYKKTVTSDSTSLSSKTLLTSTDALIKAEGTFLSQWNKREVVPFSTQSGHIVRVTDNIGSIIMEAVNTNFRNIAITVFYTKN